MIRPRNTRSLNCRSEQLGPRFSINVRSWLASRPSRDAGRRQSSARIPTCTLPANLRGEPTSAFLPESRLCAPLRDPVCEYLLYVLFVFYSTILFVFRHFSFFILPIRISSISNSYSGNNLKRGQIPENFDFYIILVQNYAMFSIVYLIFVIKFYLSINFVIDGVWRYCRATCSN